MKYKIQNTIQIKITVVTAIKLTVTRCSVKLRCTLYTSQKCKYKIQNTNHKIQNTTQIQIIVVTVIKLTVTQRSVNLRCTLYASHKYQYKKQNTNNEIQNTKYNTNNCCDCDKADSDTVLCKAEMHTVHFSPQCVLLN